MAHPQAKSPVSKPALIRLADFVASTDIRPSEATETTIRDALIDTLGCMLVGAREEVAVKARAALAPRAGAVHVIGTSLGADSAAAAFLNAVAGHALDFDDWEVPGNSHPTSVILPAILAAAHGTCAPGRAVLEAYAVGFEAIARLGEALNFDHYNAGWHTTGTFGSIGAAAAVARLWRLGREEASHALSLATSRAIGLTTQFGTDAKPLQAGFAAEAGLTAASLAKEGLSGQPSVLEGTQGYARLTAHDDRHRLSTPFDTLGAPLAIQTYGLVFKPYPSCGYTHRIVDCALALHARGRLAATEVESVGIHLPDFHAAVVSVRKPADRREARFSLPFCAAVALLRGALTLQHFDAEAWNENEIAALISRTSVHPFRPKDPGLNYDPSQPDRLVVRLRDGTILEECVGFPLGAPERPMTSEQIFEKFLRNAESVAHTAETRARLRAWPRAEDLLAVLGEWDPST